MHIFIIFHLKWKRVGSFMKEKKQAFISSIVFVLMIILLFILNINTDYHFIVMQLMVVQIIVGMLFYPKYVLASTVTLGIVHIITDTEHLSAFPIEAVLEIAIQFAVLVLILYFRKSRDLLDRRLENIIEASRVGTWEWRVDSNEIFVNERWVDTIGYTINELSPMTFDTWKSLVHPDDFIKAQDQLKKVIQGELDFYDIELRIKHKNGQYIWVHDRGKVTKRSSFGKALLLSGTYTDIDINKRTKDKINYYHQLMSYVIDYMNSGIAVHDKDMNYVYVSKKYLDEYHIEGNIIGKNHYDVFPDLPEKWKDVHKRCLQGEVIRADRDIYIHEDGHIDITRWECRPWHNEDNEIAGIIVYTEVINEYIEIEEALKESKEILQTVMDHLPIGIALHTLEPTLKFEYMNDKFPECYNTTRELLENNDFYEVVYEDEKIREVYKEAVLQAAKSKDPDSMKWNDVPIYKNGEIVKYITALVTPLSNTDKYISTVIDTTLRKQLEESLTEKANEMFVQKEKTEATLLAINDGVISTDQLGNIIAYNETAEVITGYKKEEVVGKKFGDYIRLISHESGEDLICPVTKVIDSKQPNQTRENTILITKNNEQKYVENTSSPIYNQANELIGVILVIRDVTQEKQKQLEVEYLSMHDYLTGLYNRRYFSEVLKSLDCKEHFPLGLMMMDVNGLKIINDAFGHQTGDLVLKEISKVFKDVVKSKGIVSRIGGDEFTIIVKNTDEEELLNIKEEINQKVNQTTVKNVSLSVSVGYAMKDDHSMDISDILRDAENIMYRFKLIDGDSARNQTIQAIHKTLTDKFELERKHSERVATYSRKIGEALGMHRDQLKELEMSGMFHDIGKISIPDSILYKPAKLTKEEYEIIKEHTRNGYMILRAAGEYSDLAENALYHHEHWNGKGYPEGLIGEAIPFESRIIGIADAYEAMTSDRPYRKGMAKEKAVEELLRYKGTQFDPNLVDVFVEKVLVNE